MSRFQSADSSQTQTAAALKQAALKQRSLANEGERDIALKLKAVQPLEEVVVSEREVIEHELQTLQQRVRSNIW